MSKIQQIYTRIQKSKKEQKEIKAMIKDALANSKQYQEVIDELKATKEEKKKIEDVVKSDYAKEIDTLDSLKNDIENDQMLLSDATLSTYMKGETAEVTDDYENKLVPIFKISFVRQR